MNHPKLESSSNLQITSSNSNSNHSNSSTYPPSRRLLRLLFLSLSPLLLFSSLFLLALHHDLIHPHHSIPSLATNLRSSTDAARQYSSQLLSWIDTLPSSINLRLPLAFNQLNHPSNPSNPAPHPILPLLLSARSAWMTLLRAQPTSLQDARDAYTRRYAPLSPPPGFDAWYAFARQRNFTLLDRFDSLMADLAPFRDISPNELRRRTSELATIHGVSLIQLRPDTPIQIKSRSGRWAPGTAIKDMLNIIITDSHWTFPPFDFAINERSQGRVLPRKSRPVTGEEFDYLPDSSRNLSGPRFHTFMSLSLLPFRTNFLAIFPSYTIFIHTSSLHHYPRIRFL